MKVELTVPTSLDDITVEQYQRFVKLVENNEETDFVKIKTIEIFCDTDKAHLLPYHSIDGLLAELNQVFEQKPKHKEFWGKFGFIPDLDDMTFGEYIDLNNYIDDVQSFHKALAVLYRPVVSKVANMYAIEKYIGSGAYSAQMKKAPLSLIWGAKVFFYDLANELLRVTINSSKEARLTLANERNLLNGGDGINHFTLWHKEMYSKLKPSHN